MPRVSKANRRATEISGVDKEIRNQVKHLQRDRQRRHQDLLVIISNYYDRRLFELPRDILEKPVSQGTQDDINKILGGCSKEIGPLEIDGGSKLPTASHSKRKPRDLLTVPDMKTNKFQTPINQKVPPHLMGTVTPKFNPYAPMSVVRVPKDGEVAISLTGSPLRVTSVINESKPNVIVPLENGRVLSVLPERGLRMSQIPEMDEELRSQLQVLNENLNKLLSKPLKR